MTLSDLLPHPEDALNSDAHCDAEHPLLMRHVQGAVAGASGWGRLETWYMRVRDGIRYNPFRISFDPTALRASVVLEDQSGHCVAKSLLFVAGCRALGIPALMGFAKVRNHLAAENLQEIVGASLLVPHGYAAFWNGQRWVKCTPVLDAGLCEQVKVSPLPFSKEEDQIFQPLTADGAAFLTCEEDFGLFAKLPINQLEAWFRLADSHIDPATDFKSPEE